MGGVANRIASWRGNPTNVWTGKGIAPGSSAYSFRNSPKGKIIVEPANGGFPNSKNVYDVDGYPVDLLEGGYSSFDEFKQAYGTAGSGRAWHHIVEQHADNVTLFGAEAIQHPQNLVSIPHGKGLLHMKVSGYYSSKQPFTGGVTVREWLKTQSYNEQYKFGIEVLKKFGWNPSGVVRWFK